MIDIFDIIIIIVCIIASICFVLFINRDKINWNYCYKCNCCNKNKYTNYAVMDIENINNNIKKMRESNKEPDEEELL